MHRNSVQRMPLPLHISNKVSNSFRMQLLALHLQLTMRALTWPRRHPILHGLRAALRGQPLPDVDVPQQDCGAASRHQRATKACQPWLLKPTTSAIPARHQEMR